MPTPFLISDTHFSHANMLRHLRADGTPIRAFKDVDEMNEHMITKWNSVVGPNDKVYHLGDVAMSNKGLKCLARLNGKKILVKGNHDKNTIKEYCKYFKDIKAYHKLDTVQLSHKPIHPGSLGKYYNVHGHLHEEFVRLLDGTIDQRYISVCVEHTNYTPVPLEEILQQVAKRKLAAQQLIFRH